MLFRSYFVLRPGVAESSVPENDMIKEAIRIAGESISSKPGGKRRKNAGRAACFAAGLAAGGALSALFYLLVSL